MNFFPWVLYDENYRDESTRQEICILIDSNHHDVHHSISSHFYSYDVLSFLCYQYEPSSSCTVKLKHQLNERSAQSPLFILAGRFFYPREHFQEERWTMCMDPGGTIFLFLGRWTSQSLFCVQWTETMRTTGPLLCPQWQRLFLRMSRRFSRPLAESLSWSQQQVISFIMFVEIMRLILLH